MPTINVTKSYLPDIKKYTSYIEKMYSACWLTNHGQFSQTLTQRLQDYLGVKNLILVTNATLGLQIAIKALNLTGEVLTTPFSFVATTSALAWQGLSPKFVDIDPNSYCINADLIEAAINDKTSGILPVHVYGNACEVEKIEAIAKKHQLKVIYDAAHAFAVNYQGQSLLNFGDISVLSFHATKLFHTVEGGALIIKDDAVYERVKKLMNFGLNGPVEIVDIGINGKISEPHAAMGLCVLDDMPWILAERQKVDAYYRKHLPTTVKLLDFNPKASRNYAYVPVLFNSESQLLAVTVALQQQQIIPRRYFYPSLNTVNYVQYQPMPISEDIAKRILCLPLYPELSTDSLALICSIIQDICQHG